MAAKKKHWKNGYGKNTENWLWKNDYGKMATKSWKNGCGKMATEKKISTAKYATEKWLRKKYLRKKHGYGKMAMATISRKKLAMEKNAKKRKKRAKMSKKQHDFWLVCCGQERLFIFMLFCSWVGGVRACQLFRPCCHHCLIVNCCQVLLTVTCSMKCNVSPSVLGVPGLIGMTRLID